MSKFIEVEASDISKKRRSLIYGVGLNDAEYNTNYKVNGKKITCPYYKKWHSMIMRCNDHICQKRQPTYKGCSVCNEWLIFSNFKAWMESQEWESKELDKDIIIPGNKVYSPETCCFVSHGLNNLLKPYKNKKSLLPVGVYFDKSNNKFKVTTMVDGKYKHIGRFLTPEDARKAYIYAKILEIKKHISSESNEKIKSGLKLHIKKLGE